MKYLFVVLLNMIFLTVNAQGKFYGGDGDGYAVATITSIVLPHSIIDFEVTQYENSVRADLFIRTNEKICYLVLEKSLKGEIFSPVQTIQVTGNNNGAVKVKLFDKVPSTELSYYRIKIIFCNNLVQYSSVVPIKIKQENYRFVFDVQKKIISYTVLDGGLLVVINSLGQKVHQQTIKAGAGKISLEAMRAGVYFLRFGAYAPYKIIIL